MLIGQSKGRGDEGAAAGFLLGPLGLLWIASAKDERRRCKFCREPVAAEASVCPHCQHEIGAAFNTFCPVCNHGFNVAPSRLGHVARWPRCKKMVPTKAGGDGQHPEWTLIVMSDTISKIRGYVLIALLAVVAWLALHTTILAPKPRWEYRTAILLPH